MRIALIGYGGIGRAVAAIVAREPADVEVGCVLVRPGRAAAIKPEIPQGCSIVETFSCLLASDVECVVECAGHSAVAEYGPQVLSAGRDLIVISVGALADQALLERLNRAAMKSSTQLFIPAGAVAGIEALAAARLCGLEEVRHSIIKPPAALGGTPAEKIVDLHNLNVPTVVFKGSAGLAASQYPQNANVAATVALAGLGFNRTTVRIVADPNIEHNLHRVEASGQFGSMVVEMRGQALPDNPKTSMLAALSVARSVLNRAQTIQI